MSDSKAMKLFTKLKRKGKFVNKTNKVDPRLGEHDEEPNLAKLNRDAVKSLHFIPEVERRDYGYDFSGSKGLNPDLYQGG